MIDLGSVARLVQTIKPDEKVLVTGRWLQQAVREMALGQAMMRNPVAGSLDHLVYEAEDAA